MQSGRPARRRGRKRKRKARPQARSSAPIGTDRGRRQAVEQAARGRPDRRAQVAGLSESALRLSISSWLIGALRLMPLGGIGDWNHFL